MDDKILAGINGLIVEVVTLGRGAILKFGNDIRFEYDKDLRAKRIDEYRKLWTLTGRFSGVCTRKYRERSPRGVYVPLITNICEEWEAISAPRWFEISARDMMPAEMRS